MKVARATKKLFILMLLSSTSEFQMTHFFLLNDKKAEKHDFVDIRINNSQWWFNDVMLSEEIELVKLVFKRQRDDI